MFLRKTRSIYYAYVGTYISLCLSFCLTITITIIRRLHPQQWSIPVTLQMVDYLILR